MAILPVVIQLVCSTCGKSAATEPSGPRPTRCAACSGVMVVNAAVDPAPAPKPEPTLAGSSFGKYALTAEIGRGSMGVVYDAQDTLLHRRVALKIMHSARGGEPREAVSEWQRFMQEARLTANVAKHPNIVTVYEAAVHDSRRYLAMEYVAGEPFHRWRRGRSTREQSRLLRDVSLAVHHAHEHGIIHRDLKPANVLVGKGGVPVVTDFGLARFERKNAGPSLTPRGFVVGSPAYMSPEQARGQQDVDRTTDVYAIGVMLYEAIAGRPPFDGKNPVETLSKVVEGTRVPPSRIAPLPEESDPELDRICLKAMALDPQDRYPTCADLADALTQWLDRGRGQAPRPRVGLIVATAAVALAVAGALFLIQNRRLQQAAEREEEIRAQLRATMQKVEELRTAPPAPPAPLRLSDFKSINKAPYNQATSAKLNFSEPGGFEGPLKISEAGVYEMIFTASCDAARNELAKFDVSIDGTVESSVLLKSEKPGDYAVHLKLTAGEHRMRLDFTNDFYDEVTREDRNLFIHGITLRRAK